ncbi:MAG: tRNA (adenosine(37)-N6)-dimethylallyltransferase MiaA [Planctomycetota bacterium]|jgi:tRNA dimethylallyltransferase|nr:tRNA (adenosine(37)-N6)-dimethylallyltransferase MiaA [Planctomycetota bacterium]
MAQPLRIIVGSTASGKEDLALACAKLAGGEIVSVDSMKVYRRLETATAKPSAAARAAVRHHCLDLVEPEQSFSAADFVKAADAAIQDIRSRSAIPFLSGGSAFYYKALLEGLFEGPGAEPEIRLELEARADREGTKALHRELAAKDPAAAAKIHAADRRRLIRALEVAAVTGSGISRRQTQWPGFHASGAPKEGSGRVDFFAAPRHAFTMIRLVRNRDDLRGRIRSRVGRMAANGLREEAEWVFANRKRLAQTPLQAVGYKEFFPFFLGEATWEDSLEKLCLATNRLVRGQDTWFRKFPAREVFLAPDADIGQLAGQLADTVFSPHPAKP